MNLHLDSMEVERLYSSLLIKKGRNHQINYFKTEIFELMSEIVKLNCNDSKKDTINQEIADFLICYSQFANYVYGVKDHITDSLGLNNIKTSISNKIVEFDKNLIIHIDCTIKPFEDYIKVYHNYIEDDFVNFYNKMCIISRGISNNNDLRDESEYFIINELVDRILFNLISLLKIKGLMTNIESVFIAYEYKLKRLYLRNEDNKYL